MIFTRNELVVLETIIHDTHKDRITSRERLIEETKVLALEKVIAVLLRRGYIKDIEDKGWFALKAIDGSYISRPLASPHSTLRQRTPRTPRPDIPFVTKK